MADIVRRLREPPFGTETSERNLMNVAADEITRLTAENEKLKAALHEAADELDAYYRAEYCGDHPYSKRKLAEAMRDNPARIAITPTPMEKT